MKRLGGGSNNNANTNNNNQPYDDLNDIVPTPGETDKDDTEMEDAEGAAQGGAGGFAGLNVNPYPNLNIPVDPLRSLPFQFSSNKGPLPLVAGTAPTVPPGIVLSKLSSLYNCLKHSSPFLTSFSRRLSEAI